MTSPLLNVFAVIVAALPAVTGGTLADSNTNGASSFARAWPGMPPGCPEGVWIPNAGQWPEEVRFLGRVGTAFVRVERGAIGLDFSHGALGRVYSRLVFEGSSPLAKIEGQDRRESRFSFFIGTDPSKWATGLGGYETIRYCDLYPGIHLVLHRSEGGGVKYDLLVDAGADLDQVGLRWEGLEGSEVGAGGSIICDPNLSALLQLPGKSWQVRPDGTQREVHCAWSSTGPNNFVPHVVGRDPQLPLVIDPELVWSTYLGGSGGNVDHAFAVAWDNKGDLHVGGGTGGDIGFPTTPGAYQNQTSGTSNEAFLAKLRGSDSALLYSSVFGSVGSNSVAVNRDLAVLADGSTVATGFTTSAGFPATPGAFDTNWGILAGSTGGFVVKLNEHGDQLVFSTYLKGNLGSEPAAIDVDPTTGSILIAGKAQDPTFPTTPGAFQSAHPGGFAKPFVTRLDPTGSFLEWSTFVGGSTGGETATAMRRGFDGSVTLCGLAASADFPTTPGAYETQNPGITLASGFVTRLNASGSALVWSTFLGAKHGFLEFFGLDVDVHGGVAVCGSTTSQNYPTTPGAIHPKMPSTAIPGTYFGVLTKFNSTGSALVYSTFMHADLIVSTDVAKVTLDGSGVATVIGNGPLSPLTPGSFIPNISGGLQPFVARVSPRGDRFFYSSQLGSIWDEGGDAIATLPSGRVALVGVTDGHFHITRTASQPNYGGGPRDAFVTVMDLLLEGVKEYGSSTPACLGPLTASVTRMPAAGDQRFGFYCSGAPPNGTGWLVLGSPHLQGQQFGATSVWIDLTKPISLLPVQASNEGFAEVLAPLPAGSAGQSFAAQFVFGTTHSCGGASHRCASNGLAIRVQ